MYLLDTNIVSELMKPISNSEVVRWIDSQPAFDLSVSAITYGEVLLGISLMPEGKRKQFHIELAESTFPMFEGGTLPFDKNDSIKYAEIVTHRTKIGRPISLHDAQIASIAVTNRLTLVTRNTKDFEHIEGLNLLNPWFD